MWNGHLTVVFCENLKLLLNHVPRRIDSLSCIPEELFVNMGFMSGLNHGSFCLDVFQHVCVLVKHFCSLSRCLSACVCFCVSVFVCVRVCAFVCACESLLVFVWSSPTMLPQQPASPFPWRRQRWGVGVNAIFPLYLCEGVSVCMWVCVCFVATVQHIEINTTHNHLYSRTQKQT